MSLEACGVVDREGDRIGKLQDVYVDLENDEPQFATVTEGFIGRHQSFMPLSGITVGPDDLQVAVSKEQVKSAPTIEPHGEELGAADDLAVELARAVTTLHLPILALRGGFARPAEGETPPSRPETSARPRTPGWDDARAGSAVQAEVGVTARVATAASGRGLSRPVTIRSMIAQPA